ncbi:hypothetical protein VE00_07576 [Pseudogymnoascus sp. WSF 3629]|nr:hypothetical protein VE00_07593 [Pseudogymnoascus sp. WSF 3629]OBT41488.1 hypothetical protein VE00_07576 [Pseudogymnoascus sp. WSF 3629]
MTAVPSALLPACANWAPGTAYCEKPGNKYCSIDCQKAHWLEHKKCCKSPMSKDKWSPAYYREGRKPAWEIGAAASNFHNRFGGQKYLWGNTPAMDVLNLEQNEGLNYADDIALLFAASRDLRHAVKTIANIPEGITQQFTVTMNDREFDVVARNAILLLLALTSQDSEETDTPPDIAEALIHFSTGQTLRLVLKKKDWLRFQEFCDIPDGLTPENAAKIRRAVTLAPERADYRARWYYKDASPSMRIAKQRFREDGLLLPFGHPRGDFDVPNPWLMSEQANPSSGWLTTDVQQTLSPAPEDWYGKLYFFLHKVLEKFLGRLKDLRVSFDIYNVDAKELLLNLKQGIYSRIEVANISDAYYLGICATLGLLSPLLQLPRQNPHATLITTFINAVKEVAKTENSDDQCGDSERITKFLPLQLSSLLSPSSPDMMRMWDARDSVADVDKHFERYMVCHKFKQISVDLKVEMKEVHTIVEKWPTRLKLRLGEKGDKEEFLMLLGSSFIGTERHVEGRRVE